MSFFGQVTGILEDDLERVRMGRVSTEDEALMKRLILGRGGPAGLARILGLGGSLNLPAYRTTRPVSPAGATTVVFRHKSIAKAREYPFDRNAVWFNASPEVGMAAGAKWDRRVSAVGGGAWRLPSGSAVPIGGRAITPRPKVLGCGPGTARQAHRYVARFSQDPDLAPNGKLARACEAAESAGLYRPDDLAAAPRLNDAVVYAAGPGSTALTADGGPGSGTASGRASRPTESWAGSIPLHDDRFWTTVETIERHGGRVQSRIIAELPHEEEIGMWSRAEILERFGALFDEMGLPWLGVVHRPEEGSDKRNYHVHILYHTRPAARGVDGQWIFERKHHPATRERGWIWKLRARWADEVNRELASHGIRRRVDARSYREMGIPKKPTLHLGPAAMALERRGVATRKGELVVAAEGVWRLEEAERSYAREMKRLNNRAQSVIDEANAWPPPYRKVSHEATDAAGLAGNDLMDAIEESVRARALADLARWRAVDVPSRLALLGRRDPLAREVAEELARMMAEGIEPARRHLAESRSVLSKHDRATTVACARMTAERLLEERARAAAALEAARRAAAHEGRMTDKDWRAEGDRLRGEAMASRSAVLVAERDLLNVLAARSDGKDFLQDRDRRSRLRRRLEAALTTAGSERAEDIDGFGSREDVRRAIEALLTLDRARTSAAGWTGSLDRWKRTDGDPVRRAARVIPAAEGAALERAVAAAAATLTARDGAVAAHPVASALAAERGLRLTVPASGTARPSRDRGPVPRVLGERHPSGEGASPSAVHASKNLPRTRSDDEPGDKPVAGASPAGRPPEAPFSFKAADPVGREGKRLADIDRKFSGHPDAGRQSVEQQQNPSEVRPRRGDRSSPHVGRVIPRPPSRGGRD